jgi:hypothetical protein
VGARPGRPARCDPSSSSPDGDHYLALRERIGSQRAAVSTARRIGKRAYHVLAALENTA